MTQAKRIQLVVLLEDRNTRLDKYLGSRPEVGSRNQAEYLIETQKVFLNGTPFDKASYKVREGDQLEVELKPPQNFSELVPLHEKLDILFEDEDLLILNKPSGLVVHPAHGHAQDTLVNMILAHIPEIQNEFGELRPGIVHRLDKDTSGVLAVAKNSFSLRRLGHQFKHKQVKRIYQALLVGRSIEPEGSIQSYLARSVSDRKKFASLRNDRGQVLREEGLELSTGKWAKTHYRVLQSKGHIHAVELKLETGRTHQIRVHMSEQGHAVWADPVYGKSVDSLLNVKEKAGLEKIQRLALHARSLSVFHPRTNAPLEFQVPWPEEVRAGFEELGISVFL